MIEGPVRKWLRERRERWERKFRGESSPVSYFVRYIDLTTGKTLDTVLESKREAKKREWLAGGYSPFLVEKGLLLADEWVASLAETWAPEMPEIQKVIVAKNYDRALNVADRWLKAMMA